MRPTKTFDTERVHFNVARIKKSGDTFEVVVDPDKAVLYKEGEKVDLEEVLQAQKVFSDAKKGEHASEELVKEVFGTTDPLEVARIILKEGEVQLTAEHRAKVREQKYNQLVTLIARNACDPRTKLPHPPARIKNALEEAKVHIDEFKRPQDQMAEAIRKLRPLLPISIESTTVEVHLPAVYAAKTYSLLHSLGTIKREDWQNDGSWKGLLELPAGMVTELIDKLNASTHGGADVQIIK